MMSPLERLEINLRDFESCDPATKKLAAFCNELLEAIKFTVSK